jgi:hypothetical protein
MKAVRRKLLLRAMPLLCAGLGLGSLPGLGQAQPPEDKGEHRD